MQTLSYGYKNPDNGDRGSVWFPALNDDIQQLNDHNHDGVNSAPIAGSAITGGTVSVSSANWVANGTGDYTQNITAPSGFNTTDYNIYIYITSSKLRIHPSYEYVDATTLTIHSLDNTLDYTVVFR